jgi:hypothetical protein
MKTTEVEIEAKQPVKVEQLIDFSSTPVEGGFFDMKPNSPNIPIAIPSKAPSKFIMRCKGKEQVEESSSPAKVIKK